MWPVFTEKLVRQTVWGERRPCRIGSGNKGTLGASYRREKTKECLRPEARFETTTLEIGGLEPLFRIPAPALPIHPFINPSPDARRALADALRSLADTADALRRLTEVLETPYQNNLPAQESHQNGASAANGAVWPFT